MTTQQNMTSSNSSNSRAPLVRDETDSLDLSQFPDNEPSLCIPWVYSNITKCRVLETIEAIGLGEIDRIDMVKREGRDGKPDHQRVFIHFKKWYNNETADHARELLLDEKNIKVVYDEPWFWKIWASKSKKPTGDRPKKGSGRKPFVDFSS